MRCPYCGYEATNVIDSREVDRGIRRRRQCQRCSSRFTTYERVEPQRVLYVAKKDGRREEFNREKLLNGIRKACEKRPLPTGTIDKLVEDIEAGLYSLGRAEVPSRLIGDMVMVRLKELDDIAYIRFASVYRQFADIASLKQEVDTLLSKGAASYSRSQLPLIPEETNLAPAGRRGRRKVH
ncbi:MAG TPA: transcriptional repressor NrdR [Dehalococcoidia bacterium]|nr:transcriptional repressor NrdR [Dehalococcoidia bacterium]